MAVSTRSQPINPDQLHIELKAALGASPYALSVPETGGCLVKHQDADQAKVTAVLAAHNPATQTAAQQAEAAERTQLQNLKTAFQAGGWDGLTPAQRTQVMTRIIQRLF